MRKYGLKGSTQVNTEFTFYHAEENPRFIHNFFLAERHSYQKDSAERVSAIAAACASTKYAWTHLDFITSSCHAFPPKEFYHSLKQNIHLDL